MLEGERQVKHTCHGQALKKIFFHLSRGHQIKIEKGGVVLNFFPLFNYHFLSSLTQFFGSGYQLDPYSATIHTSKNMIKWR